MAPKLIDLVKLSTAFIPGGSAVSAGIDLLGGLKDKTKTPNPLSSTPRYLTGGSITNVGDSHFKVDAPSGVDALKMNYKGKNIRLDNNELVDTSTDFVYSDIIGNPSFASQATVLASKLAKTEKRTYDDPISRNTSNLIKKNLTQLRQEQETLKQRDEVRAFRKGGNIDPNRIRDLYNEYVKNYSPQTPPLEGDIFDPLSTFDPEIARKVIANENLQNANQPSDNFNISELQDIDAIMAMGNEPSQSYNRPPLDVVRQEQDATYTSSLTSPKSSQDNTPSFGSVGDVLQLAPLVGSFASLIGGPQKDKAYYDTSKITKETFDPTRQLARNTQSYQSAVNSLSGPLTAQRATANTLLATRLNRDSDVLSQYDTLNQRANTQYESRVQNQLNNNNRQAQFVDDLNSRNLAAFDSRLQYGLRGVSNLGKAFNDKEQTNQKMKLYRTIYEDVYDNIVKSLR